MTNIRTNDRARPTEMLAFIVISLTATESTQPSPKITLKKSVVSDM
jgi:hypothetical protein